MGIKGFEVSKPGKPDPANRGWNADARDFPEPNIKNLHIVSINAGCIRGNHYHERMTEYTFIMGGEALVAVMDRANGNKEEIKVDASHEPSLVQIPPNVAHAIKNTGSNTLYLFAYSDMEQEQGSFDQVKEMILE